jgi:ATP-binding cassette subfamily A (ABC1) protein 3
MHFGALTKKRFIYFKRDIKGLVCEIVLPIIIIWLGLSVTTIQILTEEDPISLTPKLWNFPSNEIWINAGMETLTDKIPTDDTNIVKKTVADVTAFDTLMKDETEPNRLIGLYVSGVDDTNHVYDYNLFLNSTAPDTIHVGLIYADNAILKLATADDAYIKVGILPLPLTDQSKSFEGFVDGFLAAFFIAIAYAFIPSSLIMFLVTERENNAKH